MRGTGPLISDRMLFQWHKWFCKHSWVHITSYSSHLWIHAYSTNEFGQLRFSTVVFADRRHKEDKCLSYKTQNVSNMMIHKQLTVTNTTFVKYTGVTISTWILSCFP